MSLSPARCQGCGASLDLGQAGAVCPYCGRNNAAPASAPAPELRAQVLPSALAGDGAGTASKPSWFENCLNYFNRAIARFIQFGGRASRAEYWYFFLAVLLVNLALALLGLVFNESVLGDLMELLSSVFFLFVLIPSISIGVRRLHDINKSGWWYLLLLIPLIGPVVLLYWAIQPGDAHSNTYGDPEA